MLTKPKHYIKTLLLQGNLDEIKDYSIVNTLNEFDI